MSEREGNRGIRIVWDIKLQDMKEEEVISWVRQLELDAEEEYRLLEAMGIREKRDVDIVDEPDDAPMVDGENDKI